MAVVAAFSAASRRAACGLWSSITCCGGVSKSIRMHSKLHLQLCMQLYMWFVCRWPRMYISRSSQAGCLMSVSACFACQHEEAPGAVLRLVHTRVGVGFGCGPDCSCTCSSRPRDLSVLDVPVVRGVYCACVGICASLASVCVWCICIFAGAGVWVLMCVGLVGGIIACVPACACMPWRVL